MKYVENIVVGNGIMAKQLIFELKKKFSDILCISSVDFAPPCSLKSTAINCLRGTEYGVSKLGNLIYDSHSCFEKFYEKFHPAGVDKAIEVQTWVEDGSTHAKWLRRYKEYKLTNRVPFIRNQLASPLALVEVEAYVLDTNILFDWYESQNKSISHSENFVKRVEKIEDGYRVFCISGDTFECKRLYLCTSYMTNNFVELCQSVQHREHLNKHKNVHGNYLYLKIDSSVDYGLCFKESFSLSFNFLRLIYRKESGELLLSVNDSNKDSFLFDQASIEKMYKDFIDNLCLFSMPSIHEWKIYTGVRSKGFRRLPFCEEVNKNLYMITGLYKNAFSFSYFFSNQIVSVKT